MKSKFLDPDLKSERTDELDQQVVSHPVNSVNSVKCRSKKVDSDPIVQFILSFQVGTTPVLAEFGGMIPELELATRVAMSSNLGLTIRYFVVAQ